MNTSIVRPSAAPLARLLVLLAALCLLAIAAACSQSPETGKGPEASKSGAGESTEGKLVLYACPMNDIPPLPAPGKCPVCGMELTPVIMGDSEPGAVSRNHLDPAQMQLADIRTAPVESRYVTATVQLYGQVEYDDAFINEIIAPTNGIVDRVYIRRVGEYIRVEQKLFDFYSAELYDLETQLLDLVRVIPDFVSSQIGVPVNPSLRDPASPPPDAQQIQDARRRFAVLRSRLRSFGLLDRDINQVLRLEQPPGIVSVRMPNLTSKVGGVILETNAVQGAYANKGTLLAKIADPYFLWINFDAFEHDFPWLRAGQRIEFSSPARPGEVFTARITTIDPVFNEKSRTFRVGVGYNDYKTLLRPNMSLRGKVKTLLDKEGRPTSEGTAPERAPLVIPDTAPLITGERAVVYVAVPGKPGVFEGREIVLGPKADRAYVVLAGLAKGEQVVVQGAFKLDSERQILAKPSLLKPEGLVRQQDFGLTAAPPTTRSGPHSEHPPGPSPAPVFPPAEIFTTAPPPATDGHVQPAPPVTFLPGTGPSRDSQPSTKPVNE
ncbi:efflux RND transporter periplasmic adaptor subunit [Desulfovibrio sp. TomC]|uniref:efflux RND transporter periplasmic adaptor subunit n=1 Tax=Desulfovibrio sp. TomC TaxID=1562888 RepID=UPI000575D1D2|nr:efflux RND transporter periplasmic adaptor subunit [Desulfovibrio sp. TomC]KHK03946.1 putative Co/Zn/Cd efflux system membrane fusion protein [Desulfovibrio sp. TomC]